MVQIFRGNTIARKFNIGDKVEIVNGPLYGFKIGHRGKVTYYVSGLYLIQRRKGAGGVFHARELKLIKRKTN